MTVDLYLEVNSMGEGEERGREKEGKEGEWRVDKN